MMCQGHLGSVSSTLTLMLVTLTKGSKLINFFFFWFWVDLSDSLLFFFILALMHVHIVALGSWQFRIGSIALGTPTWPPNIKIKNYVTVVPSH